jgi:hypothetical protein
MSVQYGVNRLENLVDSLQRSRMQFQHSLSVARTPDQVTGSRAVVEVIDITLAHVKQALIDIKAEPKP